MARRARSKVGCSRQAAAWITYESASTVAMRLDVAVRELEVTLNHPAVSHAAGLQVHERLNLQDVLRRLRLEASYVQVLLGDLQRRFQVESGRVR